MLNKIDISLILLTYKGKVLLKLQNYTPAQQDKKTLAQQNIWCFISGSKEKNKSFEESISSSVERETSVRLRTIEFIASPLFNDIRKYFYHAKLTDENVNNINRSNGQILQFFTLKELEKLNLTVSTRLFIAEHRSLLEKESQN